ncbi:hypothetical protein D5086_012041 [Populus alba]|uniref:Uncharacterized protein n=1 Tax=Populus alba TaxID=43335 RepID=A0ACC4C104_POPAL
MNKKMKPTINIHVNFHESNNIMSVMVTCRRGTVPGGPFDGSVAGALRPHPSLYRDVCGSPSRFPVPQQALFASHLGSKFQP